MWHLLWEKRNTLTWFLVLHPRGSYILVVGCSQWCLWCAQMWRQTFVSPLASFHCWLPKRKWHRQMNKIQDWWPTRTIFWGCCFVFFFKNVQDLCPKEWKEQIKIRWKQVSSWRGASIIQQKFSATNCVTNKTSSRRFSLPFLHSRDVNASCRQIRKQQLPATWYACPLEAALKYESCFPCKVSTFQDLTRH